MLVTKIEKTCTHPALLKFTATWYGMKSNRQKSIQSIYNTSKMQRIITHTHFKSTWARHLPLKGAEILALQVDNTKWNVHIWLLTPSGQFPNMPISLRDFLEASWNSAGDPNHLNKRVHCTHLRGFTNVCTAHCWEKPDYNQLCIFKFTRTQALTSKNFVSGKFHDR